MPIIISALGTIPKGLAKGLKDLETRGRAGPSKQQHYYDWRLEITC